VEELRRKERGKWRGRGGRGEEEEGARGGGDEGWLIRVRPQLPAATRSLRSRPPVNYAAGDDSDKEDGAGAI
jgi:hypothetical protein